MAGNNTDWVAIETEYRGGNESIRSIAANHGVTEGTIRARAKKHGWTRNSSGLKRKLVDDRLHGITQSSTQSEIREKIETSAEEDAQDMGTALDVSRNVLKAMLIASKEATDPRESKVIMESTRLATDNIRKIRGLDEAPGDSEVLKDLRSVVDFIDGKTRGLPNGNGRS